MSKASRLRKRKIESVRQDLLSVNFPRIQATIILLLTATAGFLVSFSLLKLGVSSMALRYPVAIAAAYCVFLLLLRLWLWLQTPRSAPGGDVYVNIDGSSSGGTNFEFGGGGDFGGGGAGGNWGTSHSSASSGESGSFLDGIGFDFDLEEFGLIILAVAALVGGVLASLYIVYISPVLLAEILVDGVLAAGLYHRFKNVEKRYWLKSALKRTLLPAILSVIFFTIAGLALQKLAPEARSIGEVWRRLGSENSEIRQ